MSRAERLLQLMQILRLKRTPVQGEVLARQLKISLRTLYRDMASLQAQGAQIEGEAGVGYVLRPGFTMPPLMFSEDEVEALVLGCRWVQQRGDSALQEAARHVLAKVAAVLPSDLRHALDTSAMLVAPNTQKQQQIEDALLTQMRLAIRSEMKVRVQYCDQHGVPSQRTLWPFALGFFEHTRMVVAWCELRQSVRHFRADRIAKLNVLPERYPARRQALLAQWRQQEKIALD